MKPKPGSMKRSAPTSAYLSPNEIRGIRLMHGMSRAAFSKMIGIDESTLVRWEEGILIQSAANDRRLRRHATMRGRIRFNV